MSIVGKIERRDDGSRVVRIKAPPPVDLGPIESRLAKLESAPGDKQFADRLALLERANVALASELAAVTRDLADARAALAAESQARTVAVEAVSAKAGADLTARTSAVADALRGETAAALARSQTEIATALAVNGTLAAAQIERVGTAVEAVARQAAQQTGMLAERVAESHAAVVGALEGLRASSSAPARFALVRDASGQITGMSRAGG